MEHLSNDHKDRPNPHENSHNLYDETGTTAACLTENQWKLRQHDQNLPNGGKAIVEQILA